MKNVNQQAAAHFFTEGMALLKKGDMYGAQLAFTHAVNIAPQYANALMYRGAVRIGHLHDLQGGIADCEAVLRLLPNHPMPHGNLGIAYMQLEKYAQAVPHFQAAIKVNTVDASLHRMLAYCHYQLDQFHAAIQHYSMCIRFWHEQALCHDGRGVCHYGLHEFAEALDDFNAALALQPEHPGTLTNRGMVYATLRRFDEALADHDTAIRLKPLAAYYNNRGTTYLVMREYDRAQADCEQALILDETFGEAHGLRAMLHFVAGDLTAARAGFETMATYLKPDDKRALGGLSITLYASGAREEGMALWRKLVARIPNFTNPDWVKVEFLLCEPLLPTALVMLAQAQD